MMHIEITNPKKLGEASTLTAHIQNKGTPLSQADVRFEIWREGEGQHHYIAAAEHNSGEYTATYTFPKQGTYQIVLHVEKGKLHEHQKQAFQLPWIVMGFYRPFFGILSRIHVSPSTAAIGYLKKEQLSQLAQLPLFYRFISTLLLQQVSPDNHH